MDRTIAYHAMNPESHLDNKAGRFARIGFGVWLRDAIGAALGNGLFTNIAVTPSGLYVVAAPAGSNKPAAVYQLQAEDGLIPTGTSDQLPADPTQVILQGLQTAASGNIGPVSVPSPGNSVYYLLEAQVTTSDTQPELLTFVSSSGARSTATLPTARQDGITYQLKAGTPAPSPTAPTVDAGWVAVALILVPSGISTLTTGMITVLPAFAGFQPATEALPGRQTASVTLHGVPAGTTAYATINLAKTYTLIGLSTSIQSTVIVYKNAAARTADSGRPPTTPPAPGSGVIFQVTTTPGNLVVDASPEPVGSNTEATPSVAIPISASNNIGTTSDIVVDITFLPMEL